MIDPLLALCARAEGHPLQEKYLADHARGYTAWDGLIERAEAQALAPLAYLHLQKIDGTVPEETRRALSALYLRHRAANRIRNQTLAKILELFEEADIPTLILKGAALANTVYPSPGTRPMRDLDILVKKTDALPAQLKLIELGFQVELDHPPGNLATHHLPGAWRTQEGMRVSVEVHHHLLPYTKKVLTYDMLIGRSHPFMVDDRKAHTLGHEDMLWHIYRHAFARPLIEQPIRLIWVADFVSLVEKYVKEIDWGRLKQTYPQVWRVMPLFHWLSPLSDRVLEHLNMDLGHPPEGVGLSFQGWPTSSLAAQRAKGFRRILTDTFWPPVWWTRLYYGRDGRGLSWWWTRLAGHPLHIAGWLVRYTKQRKRKRGRSRT